MFVTHNRLHTIKIDRVGMVPLIEAFGDIVPKKHLLGKSSLSLCCETTFTSIMSRPNVGIDRQMKLTTTSEPTPLLFETFFEEDLRQTRRLFTEGQLGGFSVFNYHEDKGWG
jgi:hypothetical protein